MKIEYVNNVLRKLFNIQISRYFSPPPADQWDDTMSQSRTALKNFLCDNKKHIKGDCLEIGPGTWHFVENLIKDNDPKNKYYYCYSNKK